MQERTSSGPELRSELPQQHIDTLVKLDPALRLYDSVMGWLASPAAKVFPNGRFSEKLDSLEKLLETVTQALPPQDIMAVGTFGFVTGIIKEVYTKFDEAGVTVSEPAMFTGTSVDRKEMFVNTQWICWFFDKNISSLLGEEAVVLSDHVRKEVVNNVLGPELSKIYTVSVHTDVLVRSCTVRLDRAPDEQLDAAVKDYMHKN